MNIFKRIHLAWIKASIEWEAHIAVCKAQRNLAKHFKQVQKARNTGE